MWENYISLKWNFSAVNASFLMWRIVDAAAICTSGSSEPTKRNTYCLKFSLIVFNIQSGFLQFVVSIYGENNQSNWVKSNLNITILQHKSCSNNAATLQQYCSNIAASSVLYRYIWNFYFFNFYFIFWTFYL